MTDKELMQQALDAMEQHFLHHENGCAYMSEVYEALRARLAQGEPEPVAWKDVQNYEEQYEVSNAGDIRNKKTGTVLSKSLMGAGYIKADLWKDGVRWQTSAHRLVASAFIDNPEGLNEVNHINGDKTDNRACNLEWVSRSDNVNHSYYDLGNQVKPVIATNIERGEKFYYPSISAAERDGFCSAHITNVINGKRKQHKGFTFSYANTAPPQREFVGLTDEEIRNEANHHVFDESFFSGAVWARGKIKEKNNG